MLRVMVNLEHDERGVIMPVRAQAGARRSGIMGIHDGMLRVAVTVAPEKGKANRAIINVLSDAIGVPKSSIQLLTGETSARKRFLVIGQDLNELQAQLAQITPHK